MSPLSRKYDEKYIFVAFSVSFTQKVDLSSRASISRWYLSWLGSNFWSSVGGSNWASRSGGATSASIGSSSLKSPGPGSSARGLSSSIGYLGVFLPKGFLTPEIMPTYNRHFQMHKLRPIVLGNCLPDPRFLDEYGPTDGPHERV